MVEIPVTGFIILNPWTSVYNLNPEIGLMQTIFLIIIVLHMRRTIQLLDIASPNEKLVLLHVINFGLWAIVFLMEMIFDFSMDSYCLELGLLNKDDP